MRRIVIIALACALLGAGHARFATAHDESKETWVDVQTLDADEPFARPALTVHGDTLVTGGGGHARVYRRSGHSWVLSQTLAPESAAATSAFGRGLALDEHRLLIGAGLEDASATAFPLGYADVYRRQGGQWMFEARLEPNPGVTLSCPESAFGKNVAIHGDLAVVSANRMSLGPGGCGQGAVFVFQRSGAAWTQVQVLPAPQIPISNPPSGYPNFDTNFGDSMSLAGDELAIGQPGRGTNPPLQGAVHVFVRTGASFLLQQAFVAPGVAYNTADNFGVEVAIHGRTLAVAKNGGLQTFVRHGVTWSAKSEVAATTPPVGSHALARSADDFLLSATGSVQAFEVHHDGQLSAQAAVTVADAQSTSALAADPDTLVVAGAHGVHVLERH